MNPLEKNVTSLEMSKKMRNEGIDFGETAFYWVKPNNENKWYLVTSPSAIFQQPHKYYKAYTAGEMMRGLPEKIGKHYFGLAKKGGLNFAFYGKDGDFIISFFHKSPEEALSKLCLWCRKEGYLCQK
jgi:hypothetical protein